MSSIHQKGYVRRSAKKSKCYPLILVLLELNLIWQPSMSIYLVTIFCLLNYCWQWKGFLGLPRNISFRHPWILKGLGSTLKLRHISHPLLRPIHLHLIFEKSSWKNQVQQTGFLVYFELDFYCLCSLQKSISKLIFAG